MSGRSHPLLAQIPLTVSPFVSLPTATTLPYTYKSLPSTLPPSSTADPTGSQKPKYIVSTGGHAAHPDEIIASCQALQAHLQRLQDEAKQTLKEWEEAIQQRELAEKRRVAPGWLDRDEKILEPQRMSWSGSGPNPSTGAADTNQLSSGPPELAAEVPNTQTVANSEGAELDRAFGGLGL